MAGQNDAENALFDEIAKQVEVLSKMDTVQLSARTYMLKELAFAYRLVAGGPQPGGSAVAK